MLLVNSTTATGQHESGERVRHQLPDADSRLGDVGIQRRRHGRDRRALPRAELEHAQHFPGARDRASGLPLGMLPARGHSALRCRSRRIVVFAGGAAYLRFTVPAGTSGVDRLVVGRASCFTARPVHGRAIALSSCQSSVVSYQRTRQLTTQRLTTRTELKSLLPASFSFSFAASCSARLARQHRARDLDHRHRAVLARALQDAIRLLLRRSRCGA